MILGICLLVWMEIKRNSLWAHELLVAMFLPVFALYFTLDGVVLPRLLAPQSDKEVGEYIMHHYPNQQLYSYIESRMMHFFCLISMQTTASTIRSRSTSERNTIDFGGRNKQMDEEISNLSI